MKINSAEEFGKMIRDRRKKLGYTQQYLCDVTGISTSFISDLENGKKTSELEKAIYLASMLGLDVEISSRG